jgi:hypothetical protein
MHPPPDIHVEWIDDEAVVLDSGTHRLHYLNPPAALLYALILEHGYEPALQELRGRAGSSIDDDLPALLENMVERGLLVDD